MESRKIRWNGSCLLHETLARCWRRFKLFEMIQVSFSLLLFICREKDDVLISHVLNPTFLSIFWLDASPSPCWFLGIYWKCAMPASAQSMWLSWGRSLRLHSS